MHVLLRHPQNERVDPQPADRNQDKDAIFTRRLFATIDMPERPIFIQKIAVGNSRYERQYIRYNQMQSDHIIKQAESNKVDGRVADADNTKPDKTGL